MSEKRLNDRPVYTNTVTGYNKKKTANGFVYESSYYKRYYSTIDAEIYFGDLYVDEVVQIDWNIIQGQMPIFGYNSYTYDEVVSGSRIVQGNFAINFTSPNYLFEVLSIAAKSSISAMNSYNDTNTMDDAKRIDRKTTGTTIYAPSDKSPIWPETFDIDVVYGGISAVGTPVHVVLEGVKIKDCRTGLDISGESVIEIYSFVAKDIKTVV